MSQTDSTISRTHVHVELCDVFSCSFTEPLGGVKNLRVTDPTFNSLRVQWEPAAGDVRQYKILYVPAAGGPESMVLLFLLL